MKRFTSSLLVLMTAVPARAEVPHLSYSLNQVIEATLKHSPELRAAEHQSEAASARAIAERGALLPQIAVEGSIKRVSEIPTLTFPTGQSLSLTDNESYSIGPAVQYTLFKGGANYFGWKSAKAAAGSKALQAELIRRQRRLAARLAYFQAQLASEQVRLILESYKVEEAQHQDIRTRYNAGAASRVDLLSAHQQTLNRRRDLLDARADLASALREMARLTKLDENADVSLPMDGRVASGLPQAIETPTAVLDIASPSESLRDMAAYEKGRFDPEQPGILFLSKLAEASALAAKSLEGSRWPELTLLAKTSWDYPNGPIRETIHQNTIGATLNFPIFTGGQLLYGTKAKKSEARSAEEDRDAAARDLLSSWLKARDLAAALRAQMMLNETTIREAQELARLQYESYRAGRTRYLDVEDANLKVLQAKTDAARTDVRMLIQLANLESLSTLSSEQE